MHDDIPDSLSLTAEEALILEHLDLLDALNETAEQTAELGRAFIASMDSPGLE